MAKGSGDISKLTSKMPMVTEGRCNICKSGSRKKVDRLLAAQFTYKSIAEELIMNDEDFKTKELDTVRKNVERHAKRHVDIRSRAVRQIVERRAREQGVLIDEVEGTIANSRALLELIVSKGTEQLTSPETKVRFADVIEAARMLEDQAKTEYQARLEILERQVWVISEVVRFYSDPAKIPVMVEAMNWLFQNPDRKLTEYEDERRQLPQGDGNDDRLDG